MSTPNSRSRPRHIACAERDLFAVGAFKETVWSVSMAERQVVRQFDTHLDFGGKRLAISPGPDSLILTGAYHRFGLEAYNRDGLAVWKRPDLKRLQSVTSFVDSNGCDAVGVGAEDSLVVADLKTGETKEKIRGARSLYSSHADPTWFVTSNHQHFRTHDANGRTWKQPLESFGVLDAALSHESVLVAEAGGPVRCFARSGEFLWRLQFAPGEHALSACWSASGGWTIVVWPYQHGGNKRMLRVADGGVEMSEVDIGKPATESFFGDGEHLVTSDGYVRSTTTGAVVWEFGSQLEAAPQAEPTA